jgi:hypothetical protein
MSNFALRNTNSITLKSMFWRHHSNPEQLTSVRIHPTAPDSRDLLGLRLDLDAGWGKLARQGRDNVSAGGRAQDLDRNGDIFYLTSRVLQARAACIVSFGILFF